MHLKMVRRMKQKMLRKAVTVISKNPFANCYTISLHTSAAKCSHLCVGFPLLMLEKM